MLLFLFPLLLLLLGWWMLCWLALCWQALSAWPALRATPASASSRAQHRQPSCPRRPQRLGFAGGPVCQGPLSNWAQDTPGPAAGAGQAAGHQALSAAAPRRPPLRQLQRPRRAAGGLLCMRSACMLASERA